MSKTGENKWIKQTVKVSSEMLDKIMPLFLETKTRLRVVADRHYHDKSINKNSLILVDTIQTAELFIEHNVISNQNISSLLQLLSEELTQFCKESNHTVSFNCNETDKEIAMIETLAERCATMRNQIVRR